MQRLRRALILTHRYLGIVLGLLFVVWFASGITMMYAGGMPRLTQDERLDRLAPIDVGAVHLTPAEAARKAGSDGARTLLATVMGRPAYRFVGPATTTVFADNGDVLDEVSEAAAAGVAAVWASGLGCVLAVLGLLLGFTQYRRSRPSLAAAIPYTGLMRWHYLTGVVFGAFTLTWVFSGLLSMEPFGWATQPGVRIPRDALASGRVDLSRFPRVEPDRWARVMGGRPIKEVEFARIQGSPYFVVRTSRALSELPRPERLHQPYGVTGRAYGNRLLVAADSLTVREEPFSAFSLVALLKHAVPTVPIVDAQLLEDYDSYYYSRGRQTPLPILRVKFGDPLLAGGLASSTIGLVLGVRRTWRAARRPANSPAVAVSPAYPVGVKSSS